MGRKYIDCRDYKGDVKCSVAISADTDEELLDAVISMDTKSTDMQIHQNSEIK